MNTNKWLVRLDETAVADLELLDGATKERVRKKLEWLQENADRVHLKPLRQRLRGLYRLRIGDWRILLDRDDSAKTLTVIAVRHRKEVYDVVGRR